MAAFEMLRIANTSLGMHQTWLDALAHNISNVNTVTGTDEDAFQEQMVRAQSRADGGVDIDFGHDRSCRGNGMVRVSA